MNKDKTTIIIIVLIALCLIAGVIGWTRGSKNNETPSTPTNTPKEVISYKQVEIFELNSKLSNLQFATNLNAAKVEGESIMEAYIENGIVKFNYNVKGSEFGNDIVKTYEVSTVKDVIGVGMGLSVQGNGSVKTYLLTKDGKVYMIRDDFSNPDGFGKVVELNVNTAVSMVVVDENFTLDDNAQTTLPTVYIKTSDNKVLTDEINLTEGNTLVEVVEQK